jgi:hypothetical protein
MACRAKGLTLGLGQNTPREPSEAIAGVRLAAVAYRSDLFAKLQLRLDE